ncbi:MAG: bifunctional acetate--CoA ligase family protein/GNAT family N-acetyltransferase [Deltaproteobacteria bacterium]|nr:bifunctional acetate--CoA ligase family protein/GNAT family N-acetyltransferase [Deltaproteobacteria bacterium]
MGLYNLGKIFEPDSMAVVGASDKRGSIGRALIQNAVLGGFQGPIYPVNPHRAEVNGLRAYTSVTAVEGDVDLAVIATPIAAVPEVMEDCVKKGVRASIVISAGGREIGEQGLALEKRIDEKARQGGIRVVGPNCLGVICPRCRLNASFANRMPEDGKLAFISQSGALCTAILDLSVKEHIGFSHFVSTGSMLDVDFGDLIDYLGDEPQVQSILLYVEHLKSFRKFMSAARAVSRVKPIVVLKSGRSEAGAEAASSHTGAMAAEDAVYDAAFKRAGVVRVNTIGDLFDCAELLAKQPRPRGPRVIVVTNAGGPGVMAADSLSENGLELTRLEPGTLEKLDRVLPPHWSRGNPVDILGDATPERYAGAIEQCLEDPGMDGMLVILNPQAMTDPAEAARSLAQAVKGRPHPVFASWIGGLAVEEGRTLLNEAGIPTYDTPEQAIRAFMHLHEYAENLKALQEIPPQHAHYIRFDHERLRELVRQGLRKGRLTEPESKELLSACGIPVNRTEIAADEERAAELAGGMGFPVVLKILSREITHKSDVRGVEVGLRDGDEVKRAWRAMMARVRSFDPDAVVDGATVQPMVVDPDYELLLGAKRDVHFGPVVLFGMGGFLAEFFRDRALGLPPLNRNLARMLMEETRVNELLHGYRNRPPAKAELLQEMIVQLAHLLVDFPEVAELDMNPVIVKDGVPQVVDARVILTPSPVSSPHHLVISPYPDQYEYRETTAKGLEIFIRPIKPEDAPLLLDLFGHLSRESVYNRFFSPLKTLSHDMLVRFSQIDYDREIAMVALDSEEENRILGVARIILGPDKDRGEFAIAVGDPWQGMGVGSRLLQHALRIAGDWGVRTVYGKVLAENRRMVQLARKGGFHVKRDGSGEYAITVDLDQKARSENESVPI